LGFALHSSFLCNRFEFAGIFILKLKVYHVFTDIVHLPTALHRLQTLFCFHCQCSRKVVMSTERMRGSRLLLGRVSIHLKGAPEVERRRHRGGWLGLGKGLSPPEKIFVFLTSKW